MTEEEKKRKYDRELKAALDILAEAAKTQAEMVAAVMEMEKQATAGVAYMHAMVLESSAGINAIAKYFEELNRPLAEIAEIMYSSSVSKAVLELSRIGEEYRKAMIRMIEMARKIQTEEVISNMGTISTGKFAESLLNYIAILETELEKKSKELADKDEIIRELRKLLAERKKETKKFVV